MEKTGYPIEMYTLEKNMQIAERDGNGIRDLILIYRKAKIASLLKIH